jgi:hypothetical protein
MAGHHSAQLVVVVLLGGLAEWFLYGYVQPEKISLGDKLAYTVLVVCAMGYLLIAS